MMQDRRLGAWVAVVFMLILTASVASAASPAEGKWFGMVFAGSYSPGPDVIDDETAFGVRVGYVISPHVSVVGSLATVDAESQFDQKQIIGNIEGDFTFLDANAFYMFRPDKKFRFTIGGGLGMAFASIDGLVIDGKTSLTFNDYTDDGFTANIGLGPVFRVNDRVFLRLLSRFRWFESRDDDEVDREITLGVGFVFGN